MKLLTPIAAIFSITLLAFNNLAPDPVVETRDRSQPAQKIQAAILLDVSGSMTGLIEQAKAQLWNMVSVMGRVKCEGGTPGIEIALYEYGRSSNGSGNGYIRMISPFTSDLDRLSAELFRLQINGSEEYCGQVIYNALRDLNWDTSSNNYKVIFISGNEDFLQGKITFTQACKEAQRKGVIVNTIYCGDREQGIREHWNLNGECGQGSYTNINHNARQEEIPTPYDSLLFSLNNQLNKTYIYFGDRGASAYEEQSRVDQMNSTMSKSVAAKRVAVKGKKELYNNAAWDLIDAASADSTIVTRVDMNTLPQSLQGKDRKELQQIVMMKKAERGIIQQRIANISLQRESFIAAEKARTSGNKNISTLETEIEMIIRSQVGKFRMTID